MANPGHPYGHSMMSQQGIGQQFPANTMANQQQQPQQQGTMSNQQSMMGVQQTQQGMMGIQTQGSLPQQVGTCLSSHIIVSGRGQHSSSPESLSSSHIIFILPLSFFLKK